MWLKELVEKFLAAKEVGMMSKMDKLNQEPTIGYNVISFLLRAYMWITKQRVFVVYGRGDTDVES